MLPVAHHACTLATGALWSSCTMMVNPFGKIHFCAVLGGNAIVDDPPEGGAAFRLIMASNRARGKNFASWMRCIAIKRVNRDSSNRYNVTSALRFNGSRG